MQIELRLVPKKRPPARAQRRSKNKTNMFKRETGMLLSGYDSFQVYGLH
jgi:hypothetical protein